MADPGNGDNKLKDLTAILVLLAPFVAGLGALAVTGTIGRVQRNEPLWIAIALLLVLLAGAVWLASDLLSKPTEQTLVRGAAVAIALIGFGIGFLAAILTADDEPRPQIEASLSKDRILTAKVSASSMETEDRLAIFVDALTRVPTKDTFKADPVYRAYEGPDADGNVKVAFTTGIPKGRYTDVGVKAFTNDIADACDDQLAEDAATEGTTTVKGKRESGTGCVTMAIVKK